MYIERLYLFTATTKKIYPNMSIVISIKSVHMTHFL
jgi:hypothetical protein